MAFTTGSAPEGTDGDAEEETGSRRGGGGEMRVSELYDSLRYDYDNAADVHQPINSTLFPSVGPSVRVRAACPLRACAYRNAREASRWTDRKRRLIFNSAFFPLFFYSFFVATVLCPAAVGCESARVHRDTRIALYYQPKLRFVFAVRCGAVRQFGKLEIIAVGDKTAFYVFILIAYFYISFIIFVIPGLEALAGMARL